MAFAYFKIGFKIGPTLGKKLASGYPLRQIFFPLSPLVKPEGILLSPLIKTPQHVIFDIVRILQDSKVLKVEKMTDRDSKINEREILRFFFETIKDIEPQDGSVSDLKIVKTTQNKLRDALRGSEYRCTCAKMTWGCICEECQGSDRELVSLRTFYRNMRNAKRNQLTTDLIKQFIENTERDLAA